MVSKGKIGKSEEEIFLLVILILCALTRLVRVYHAVVRFSSKNALK